LVIVLLLVCVGAAVLLWPRGSGSAPDACGPVTQKPARSGVEPAGQATVCLVNRERTTRGLPQLRLNPLLSATSLEHSQDMVRLNYFEHTSADGRTVGDRLRIIGWSRGVNASAGENIAYGVGSKSTPKAIVAAWMRSKGHREDILRPAFTEIGIGVALGAPEVTASDSATYTTDFGGIVDPSLPNG
jgi:uncharacterized protein YkwD